MFEVDLGSLNRDGNLSISSAKSPLKSHAPFSKMGLNGAVCATPPFAPPAKSPLTPGALEILKFHYR
jgi:hypothetical protein